MKFDKWMSKEGLSDSSVLKYFGAIEGALSSWASDAGLIDGNLLEITSQSKFDSLATHIRSLPIFLDRNATGHNMYGSALNKYSQYLGEGAISNLEEDIEDILSANNIKNTEKAQLVNARIGQGQFRKALLSYWGQCAVTGVKNATMLLASHIKPWSKCSNNERLDSFNGLLLVPNLDRAFDQGLISFSDSGNILISPELENPEKLGINLHMHISLAPEHQIYMQFHREKVFDNSVKLSNY